jgi:hypothetical protein
METSFNKQFGYLLRIKTQADGTVNVDRSVRLNETYNIPNENEKWIIESRIFEKKDSVKEIKPPQKST